MTLKTNDIPYVALQLIDVFFIFLYIFWETIELCSTEGEEHST